MNASIPMCDGFLLIVIHTWHLCLSFWSQDGSARIRQITLWNVYFIIIISFFIFRAAYVCPSLYLY